MKKGSYMIPFKFTVENGITTFHYKVSELRNFIQLGKRDGNVGMIVIHRKDNVLTYKGFGTIEHPMKDMWSLSLVHFPQMDGKMLTDEERLLPVKPFFSEGSYRYTILNFK